MVLLMIDVKVRSLKCKEYGKKTKESKRRNEKPET
jgi:hypothetical protein